MDAVLDCPDETPPDVRRALEQLLEDQTLRSVVFRTQTESTNTDALGEVHRGLESGLLPRLHWADRQTAGRGRQGNTWISEGNALTFSLLLAGENLLESPLSMFVGVAVAQAIEFHSAPVRVGLKWPNDLYADGRKLGGILIESSQAHLDQVVVGVGVNVDDAPTLQSDREVAATSLAEIAPRTVTRTDWLVAMVESIVQTLNEVDHAGLMEAFRERCVLTDTQVRLTQKDQSFSGRCTGVTENGELRLSIDGESRTFHSGDARRVR
ncbi:MAG: biotin--[acetyl-CoA-carboxylase] ligase [Planctomycetota bacterium]